MPRRCCRSPSVFLHRAIPTIRAPQQSTRIWTLVLRTSFHQCMRSRVKQRRARGLRPQNPGVGHPLSTMEVQPQLPELQPTVQGLLRCRYQQLLLRTNAKQQKHKHAPARLLRLRCATYRPPRAPNRYPPGKSSTHRAVKSRATLHNRHKKRLK